MIVQAELKWDDRVRIILERLPDTVTYAIARRTLDMVGSMQVTPFDTGRMERSMYAEGVQKGNSGYYIGNFTDYASDVYMYPQSTNWTRKSSKAKWFDTVWQSKGPAITKECIERYSKI